MTQCVEWTETYLIEDQKCELDDMLSKLTQKEEQKEER